MANKNSTQRPNRRNLLFNPSSPPKFPGTSSGTGKSVGGVVKIRTACLLYVGGIAVSLVVLFHASAFAIHLSKIETEIQNISSGSRTGYKSISDFVTSARGHTAGAGIQNYDSNTKIQSIGSLTGSQDEHAPWRKSKVLPQWMKDYFQWHQTILSNLTDHNVYDYDYLVYTCLETDRACGGGADRLKPLPVLLLLGSKMKRLVFYHWEKPAPLQEFLVPPPDGLDWRWPPHPFLANHSFTKLGALTLNGVRKQLSLAKDRESGKLTKSDENDSAVEALPKIMSVRFQITGHGMNDYNDMRQNAEHNYDDIFRDCWNSVFIPAPQIQKIIDDKLGEFHIHENEYHAIHIRSLYHRQFKADFQQNLTHNAVNCLYKLLTLAGTPMKATKPVFLSTDSPNTTRQTMDYARSKGLQQVWSTRDPYDSMAIDASSTLHLDRGQNFIEKKARAWTRHDPHRYYDTFVDLYLLSKARCIVFNVGSFGKWANLLSSNSSCHYSHMKDKTCFFPDNAFA